MITGIISVDSDKFVKGTYRCVHLSIYNGEVFNAQSSRAEINFTGGDFTRDYLEAYMKAVDEGCEHISLSSSVFDFMRLEGYDFLDAFEDE